ncbi:hypothetical protein M9Y10_033747 [Tritrichomonas musculus]|uniref:Uncharacterized protein n=1 Tax=Tritrichomonas musculus TaxID=1915356 RepID=A0ABR2KD04_9EUKA
MSGEQPIVMTAEQLWALNNEEEIEKFRGEPTEITEFDHKIARDMRDFAKNFNTTRADNEVRVHSNANEQYDDEENFFDYVSVSYPTPK